jgi:hypothetical protein
MSNPFRVPLRVPLRVAAGVVAGLVVLMLSVPMPESWSEPVRAQQLAQTSGKKSEGRIRSRSAPPKSTQRKGAPGAAAPAASAQKPQERIPFTAAQAAAAVVPGIPDARAWGDSAADFARLLPQASGPWLAISGGGADGAYGGGVLAGWSAAGSRPEFAVVTGVSIGALVAPFAFLGPRYDEVIRKNFTTISAADIFEDRVTRDSLLDHWPLRRQIEERVTPQLLAEIAAEHARGRRLLIVTTNLDAGRRTVWSMGAIAASGGERALKLFRDVLLASTAIPGFFSPVGFEVEAEGKRFEELHNDGTLTAPFFVVPDEMLEAGSKSRLPFSSLFVLVGSKAASELSMPERTITGVLGRSIAVALTAALRTQMILTYVGAQRHGVDVRFAPVDPSFDFPSRGPFDGKYMQALYEVGVAAGKSGTAFTGTPPGLSVSRAEGAQ